MDLVFRYNPEVEDVEIVSILNGSDETVVDTIGTDVFQSWVSTYNDKHDYVQRVDVDALVSEQVEAAVAEATAKAEAEKTEAVEEAKRVAAEAAAQTQE